MSLTNYSAEYVPLTQDPNQTIRVILGNQQVVIGITSTGNGVFVSVNSNGVDIINSVLALNQMALMVNYYMGFVGQLMFYDTQGESDPTWDGFGTRYLLVYMDTDNYAAFQLNHGGL